MIALALSLLLPAHALSPADHHQILQIESQRQPPLALGGFVRSEDAATRARAARALGRLRDAGALAPLRRLVVDEEASVRREAAFALGQTPGSDRVLLTRAEAETDRGVRVALLEALGKQGTGDALPVLLAALDTRPPALRAPEIAPAAAIAVGRMAMRGVEGLPSDAAIDALLLQLRRFDRPTRRAAAFALYRLRPAEIPAPLRERLISGVRAESDPVAQAFGVRALGRLPGEQVAVLLAELATDPDAGVRTAVARTAGGSGWEGVTTLLDDPVPGVRRAAIEAVGAIEALDRVALLTPHIEAGRVSRDPDETSVRAEAADAIGALGGAGLLEKPDELLAMAVPGALRAAATAWVREPDELIRLGMGDPELAVQTTAAMRLCEVAPESSGELLGSTDPMVQAIAAECLVEHPEADTREELVELFSEASEPDVIRATALALEALLTNARKIDAGLKTRVEARASPPATNVRAAVGKLADTIGVRLGEVERRPLEVSLDQIAEARIAVVHTSRGSFSFALLSDEAPLTVWNFSTLAESGYFDGITTHRVVPDFVVQAGDPRGDGTGGPGWLIPDEINPVRYDEGMVGMALSGPDTGGSQWFVTLSPQPHLDGGYTVFGEVISGMQVLRGMAPGDRIERVVIERISLAMKGMSVDEPTPAGEETDADESIPDESAQDEGEVDEE